MRKVLLIVDNQYLINSTIKRQQDVKIGGVKMTKELAIYLLESKDVWLTYEGRKQIIELLEGKKVTQRV